MMTHHQVRALLDDYLDGELEAAQYEQVGQHLAECGRCTAEAAALKKLIGDARALPKQVAPDRDLWPEISARLARKAEATTLVLPLRRRRRGWPGGLAGRPALLAAAAVVLITLSSAITVVLVRGGAAGDARPAMAAAPPAAAVPALAAFQPAEAEFQRAARELAGVLDTRRDALAPETVEVIERNIAIIDAAIAEARAALAADPASGSLAEMLADSYRAKVALLQNAVLIGVEA